MRSGKTKRNLAYAALAIASIIVLSYLAFFFSSQPSNSPSNPPLQPSTAPLKAAIVDQLGIHSPNQSFTNTATNILTQAGYTVDYYEWNEATVNCFRNLATHGYALIILRTHSAVVEAEPNYVCIFTSEPFNETKHHSEWTSGYLGRARYFTNETDYYFAITPRFVQYSMKGTFENTTIIMMGCDGLTHTNMAEAFIRRGAEAYVSWDGPVLTSHTDTATSNLLKHLVTEEQTVPSAVAETMQEVGADPIYLADLAFYPHERS